MCSIHDSEDGEIQNLIEDEKIDRIDEYKCRKCHVNSAAIKLRVKDFYCNECFLIAVTHKFRATLGKSKIVKSTDTILVGFSGNTRSTALLHLIKAGMHESVHKRLVFQIKVLFIDEGAVKQQNSDKRQQIINEIDEQIKKIGFEAFYASLSEVLDKYSSIEDVKIDKIDAYSSKIGEDDDKDTYLSDIFNKLPNNTSKIDFIKKLRYQMLIKAAKKLGCTKIFAGDDAQSLAIDILSNVSLGRGSQLSSDIGFVDQRDPEIMILRPMKDFSRHEVEFYIKTHCLTTVDTRKLIQSTHSDAYSSLQQLTNQFVTDLETRFSGTVSTVFRTGEKMTADNGNTKNDNETCIFCSGLLDSKPLDNGISAIDATMFSRLISLQGLKAQIDVKYDFTENLINFDDLRLDDVDNRNGTKCDCNNDCKKKGSGECEDVTIKNVHKFLCYGCRLIFQCNFDLENVPYFILDRCREKLCLESMKEQITDFLL